MIAYCECGAKITVFVNAKKRGRILPAMSHARGHDLCHKCFMVLMARANAEAMRQSAAMMVTA